MSAAATPVIGQDAAAMLPLRGATLPFLSFAFAYFAFAYFFSALVRGVTATLAPALSAELGLNAGHLVGLFCVSSTVVALSQPAVGQAFAPALAGRALSAYNLVIFVGVFLLQWGLGLAIDRFKALGWTLESSYQGAFALLAGCCLLSYVWFLRRDDRAAARLA
jgi:hypothetical protein